MTNAEINYRNLFSLWRLYGAKKFTLSHTSSLWFNESWPYRSWIEEAENNYCDNSKEPLLTRTTNVLSLLPRKTVFYNVHNIPAQILNRKPFHTPASVLRKAGLVEGFTQHAMHLPLHKWQPPLQASPVIELREIASKKDMDQWTAVGSEAFNYQIDSTSISRALRSSDVNCFLAMADGLPVATALLYQTGSTMGFHQVAVHPTMQGKGIANKLMVDLITHCKDRGIDTIALQASDAGKPLYEQLGFVELFEIVNYQKRQIQGAASPQKICGHQPSHDSNARLLQARF